MKESYDKVKLTVSEVLKTISYLLQERKIDKLYKRIDEDLTIIYKKDEKFEEESKEETKGDQKEEVKQKKRRKKDFLKPPDIFGKKINIMVADYLSDKKIKRLQDNIKKVCGS